MDLINVTKGIIKVIHRWTFKAMAKRKRPKHYIEKTQIEQHDPHPKYKGQRMMYKKSLKIPKG